MMHSKLSVTMALLLVAGCGPLVQVGGSSAPPAALLTLGATAPEAVPAGNAAVDPDTTISVETPAVAGALRTFRIPVMIDDTSIQYLAQGRWSEPPSRLFRRVVADTLVYAGIPVIDSQSTGLTARQRLTGELTAFGVDTRESPIVRVRYEATLSGPAGVYQRRFERTEPLAIVNSDHAAVALNRAANAVAQDVAQWIRQTPASVPAATTSASGH